MFSEARMAESRRKLEAVMYLALGVYIKKEPQEADNWRDKDWGMIFGHLKHEIEEIGRSESQDRRLHNSLDALCLAAMLAVKAMEEIPKGEVKKV